MKIAFFFFSILYYIIWQSYFFTSIFSHKESGSRKNFMFSIKQETNNLTQIYHNCNAKSIIFLNFLFQYLICFFFLLLLKYVQISLLLFFECLALPLSKLKIITILPKVQTPIPSKPIPLSLNFIIIYHLDKLHLLS